MALADDPATLRYVNRINGFRETRRRTKAANNHARLYVPRGRDQHAAMSALLLYLADAYRNPPIYAPTPASAVKTALLELARFAFVVDAQPSRERREQMRYWLRLEGAAEMVVRRGAVRCMNLSCAAGANASGYCMNCEQTKAVKSAHNAALKSIGSLWEGAMAGALANVPSASTSIRRAA